MKTLFSTLLLLTWSLWFGGQMTLVICVTALFHHDKALGIQGAPYLFLAYEPYQMIVALIALASSASLLLLTRRRLQIWTTLLLFIAAIGAFASVAIITPRIMQLRAEDKIQTPEFDTLHHRATNVYSSEAVLLLLAGLLIPHALRTTESPKTIHESAPAPAPLA